MCGLSDHEAQLIKINNIDLQPSNRYHTVRKVNKHIMADFVTKLTCLQRHKIADRTELLGRSASSWHYFELLGISIKQMTVERVAWLVT
jgi:hypothetical protein